MLQRHTVTPGVRPGDQFGQTGIVVSVDGSGNAAVLDPSADSPPSLAIKVTYRLANPLVSLSKDPINIEFSVTAGDE